MSNVYALVAGVETPSAAEKVMDPLNTAVGVPEISPEPEPRDRPLGRVPLVRDQV